ncbi:MAG: ABC transporter ATP-binding protein [Gammaproteobacteria bacterium]|nr:MAG: ABC transporter ATP-binding protein [Gammaproteobacteria bacterium]
MQSSVIEARGLSKHYGNFTAIDGIDFDVRKGMTTALLGGNGAGKTTTLSMLLGLLIPSSGSIRILGEDMLRHRHRVLSRINFSSPYTDIPHRLTVRENLTVYAHLYSLKNIKERLQVLSDELELDRFWKQPFGKLSAGERTRVSLAKALLNTPELLLLDEPTASLDPDTADYVRGYLEAYQKKTGATILLASHNMQEVERLCSNVLMLRQGRIVDQGTPQDLLTRYGRDNLDDVFIDIARRGKA